MIEDGWLLKGILMVILLEDDTGMVVQDDTKQVHSRKYNGMVEAEALRACS